jgi:hypothetical protein
MRSTKGHPAISSWVLAEKESAMQIDDQILNCTVFLGRPLEHGFSADGTGFLVALEIAELKFHYIVTCRHLARPTVSARDMTPNNETIWIRINREADKPPKVIETKRSDWLYHTNKRVDVSVYPFDLTKHDPDNDLEMTTLRVDDDANLVYREELHKRWGLHLGDQIFTVGCFVGRVGDKKNIPVIRTGTIAAKPDEPIAGVSHQSAAYLIETHSLGGASGSPTFLHADPFKRVPHSLVVKSQDGKSSHSPYFLIGMVQGYHSGQYADDFIADDDEQKIVPSDVDFNAGIGVVIPIAQIMDLLNRDDFREARMATIEAKKKQTGHHDASARAPKVFPPATDANPNHQADFTRLVDVAARKRPQGVQT